MPNALLSAIVRLNFLKLCHEGLGDLPIFGLTFGQKSLIILLSNEGNEDSVNVPDEK